MSEQRSTECREARERVHERLDGPVRAEQQQRLDEHLAACSACRELLDELESIQRALREMPPHRLPDEDLEAVWDRTVRSEPVTRMRRVQWRAVAAAVALAAVLGAAWVGINGRDAAPPDDIFSDADARRAAAEARQVLTITASALRRTQDRTFDVLTDAVTPALQRVPVRLPETADAERRSGT